MADERDSPVALITGASSGIGLELARELVGRGYRVAMLARRKELLDEQAREMGAGRAATYGLDVRDAAAVAGAVESVIRDWGRIDLAIANAGVSLPTRADRFRLEDAVLTFRTNLEGMVNLFDPVIAHMLERGRGRFAGIASLSGFRGLPGASVYSASKAAMQAFLEASRVELAGSGVRVTIVNPGFVKTPMTEKNRFPMPFLMGAPEAARRIANGIERGKREVNFPLGTVLLTRMLRVLPNAVFDRALQPFARRKTDPGKLRR